MRVRSLQGTKASEHQKQVQRVLKGMRGKARGFGIEEVSECEARLPEKPFLWSVDTLVKTIKGFWLVFEFDGVLHGAHAGMTASTRFRNNILGGWGYFVIVITEEEWANAHTTEQQEQLLRSKIPAEAL